MNRRMCLVLFVMSLSLSAGYVQGQANKLITGNSAGPIKSGMTIAEAQKAAKPMKVDDGENVFEGDTVYRVTSGKKLLLTFWESKQSGTGKVMGIEVWDASYHTKKRAHVGMSLTDLEKIYGKLKEIEYFGGEGNGPEGEFATFARQPSGISFQVAARGKGKMAGVYPKGLSDIDLEGHPTTKYNSGAYLKMIGVGGE